MSLFKNKSYALAAVISLFLILWLVSGIFKPRTTETDHTSATEKNSTLKQVPVQILMAIEHPKILNLYGHTKVKRTVTIKTQTSGKVVEIFANKGQDVKEGDLLIKLSEDDRVAKLKSAQTAVHFRELEFNASRKLIEKNFRSQTTLAESESQLNAARADLKAMELDLAHTLIKAPFNGILENRTVEIGDYISIGQDVALLIDVHPLVIQSNVAEKDISFIELGQVARVKIGANPPLLGKISYISQESNDETRTFDIEIEVEQPEPFLPAGLTSEIDITLKTIPAFKISPSALSLSKTGELGIKTVNKDNIVTFHSIEIIEDGSDGIWISLDQKEIQLISLGHDYVREGDQVIPVSNEPQSN